MKKTILISVVLGCLVLPLIVGAVALPVEQTDPSTLSFEKMIDRLADWLLGILLSVAVIFLIIAGFFFVTARGDTDKVTTARNFVLYALVGVAVGVASYALVKFVQTSVSI